MADRIDTASLRLIADAVEDQSAKIDKAEFCYNVYLNAESESESATRAHDRLLAALDALFGYSKSDAV